MTLFFQTLKAYKYALLHLQQRKPGKPCGGTKAAVPPRLRCFRLRCWWCCLGPATRIALIDQFYWLKAPGYFLCMFGTHARHSTQDHESSMMSSTWNEKETTPSDPSTLRSDYLRRSAMSHAFFHSTEYPPFPYRFATFRTSKKVHFTLPYRAHYAQFIILHARIRGISQEGAR